MTPEDALRFWEEAHHPLSEVHRESFKKRVEELGLTEYLSSWFKAAVRQEKRLIDVAELLEQRNRERQALKGKLTEPRYGRSEFKGRDKGDFGICPAPRSSGGSGGRSWISGE